MSKTKLRIDHIEKIEKMTFERVKAAIASGKTIDARNWASENDFGNICVCAVGAIALNGAPLIVNNMRTPEVFAMASSELKKLRIPQAYWGFVLDCISAGFEDSAYCARSNGGVGEGFSYHFTRFSKRYFNDNTNHSVLEEIAPRTKTGETDHPSVVFGYQRLYNLGKKVFEKYAVKEA